MHSSKLNSIFPTTIMVVFLLCLDLITKYVFVDIGQGGERRRVQAVYNSGSAWSMPIPSVVAVVGAIGIIIYIYKYLLYDRVVFFWEWIAYGLFIAGALGNTYDRLIYGAVRDFIDIFDRYPIFNLADCFLVLGVVIYLLWMWRGERG